MADWPVTFETHNLTRIAERTAVASSATEDTLGDWVEVEDSLPFDINKILVLCDHDQGNFLFKFGVGAASSEVDITELIHVGVRQASYGRRYYFELPVSLPAGTRIAVKTQRDITGAANIYIDLYVGRVGSFFRDLNSSFIYCGGITTADTGMISIDPGTSADTKGSYVEIIASTIIASKGLIVLIGDQSDSSRSDYWWALDIAIGAAGSEVIIIPDMVIGSIGAADTIMPQFSGRFDICIPAGTRISGRVKSSGTNSGYRIIDVGVILL